MTEIWVLVEHADDALDACSVMLLKHVSVLAGSSPNSRVRAICFSGEGIDKSQVVAEIGSWGVGNVVVLPEASGSVTANTEAVTSLYDSFGAPGVLLVPGTPTFIELASRLSVKRSLPIIPDCTEISFSEEYGFRFGVTTGGGKAVIDAEVVPGSSPVVVMPQRDFNGLLDISPYEHPAVETVDAVMTDSSSDLQLIEETRISAEDMNLEEAQVILSGGRGMGSAEGFEPLFELAELMGAHVGSSRVATDLGWIDRKHLVGMSGSTVRPAVYVAFGISGDPHHQMGMRDSQAIVAVNNDPKAPIFRVAQHAFLGDADEVIRCAIKRLTDMKKTG